MAGESGSDALVQEMVDWHFDPKTGSPYWLRREKELGFDARREIKTLDDLDRFPADVVEDWRSVPVTELAPRGLDRRRLVVAETGGTTGSPTRVLMDFAVRDSEYFNRAMDSFGFPKASADGDGSDGAHYLRIGPARPHSTGYFNPWLAELRGYVFHSLDLDPRWVKKLVRGGSRAESNRYVDHIIEQALMILRTQPITVLSTTPPLLQALCQHKEAYALIKRKVRWCVWGGTSATDEFVRVLRDELLPGIHLLGSYGNTLSGVNLQRVPAPDDPSPCVFDVEPGAIVRIVDPVDPRREVVHGAEGQVRITTLRKDIFLPHHLERDTAMRVAPNARYRTDGIARVRPIGGGGVEVEGVY